MATPSLNCSKINCTLIYSTLVVTIQANPQTVRLLFPKLLLVENAKLFKEDLLRRNVKNSSALNLHSLRLGINSIIALSNSLQNRKYDKLNLADNAVSDYGMHAIKNIINNTGVKIMNMASNMISGEGLELILDDLISNTHLKSLDIGVVEGSMRKNSLGIQGAVCISAILIRNKVIECLSINDNDLGPDGGECIGIALS